MPVIIPEDMVDAAVDAFNRVHWTVGTDNAIRAALEAALAVAGSQPAPTPVDDWRVSMEARLSALEAIYEGKAAEPAFDGTFDAACRAAKKGWKVRRKRYAGKPALTWRNDEWWFDLPASLGPLSIKVGPESRAATDWIIVDE